MWAEEDFDDEHGEEWKASKLEDIIEVLDQLEEKYHGLDFWGKDIKLTAENVVNVLENRFNVEENYPEEIKLLSDSKTAEYQKGFNKGILAVIWLIYGSQMEGIEESLKDFPRIP